MDEEVGGESHETNGAEGPTEKFGRFVAPTLKPAENFSSGSHQYHPPYSKTTDYGLQSPVAIAPRK